MVENYGRALQFQGVPCNSCDAQLSCVKLSDCVLKRLRRKAASGAIAFEPRLERNHPFANVRRSLRRNHG